ncbi:hypothetical protein LR48_Vigan10g244700 [Vigna angularis]|uniref:Vesicle transport v-SNARE 13 n=2 Tax=Phaseolus angularis TaxID=3914 RepID=A0A0L9VNC4_PHAAN|nr:Vesicle transport v-SNARE 13 [Vigna angularis]KOM56555.1 hypothetical protein LR48_Vigan10g244700 [Vigna angularis]BAU01306.1 hypothetical protein VIGAN_11051500 [Vigna angularis var. angularis]
MSNVFEGYERQYCELLANLTKKCTAAGALNGEQKKQKVSEIKTGIDAAEALVRKMELEARSLQPNGNVLLAKLMQYKSDLNNLKTEVKRIVCSAWDELLDGMADAMKPSVVSSIKGPKQSYLTAVRDYYASATSQDDLRTYYIAKANFHAVMGTYHIVSKNFSKAAEEFNSVSEELRASEAYKTTGSTGASSLLTCSSPPSAEAYNKTTG